jgi:hypothetical protein
MSRKGTGTVDCYLCCLPIAGGADRTKEHFIPRTFYENRKLPDENDLSFPAHRSCNESTTKEEEWVATCLALSNPLGPSSGERWDRAVRAVSRDKAIAMRTALVRDAIDLPGGASAIPVGMGRLTWVLAKIVKGLVVRSTGTLLPNGTPWSIRHGNYESAIALEAPLFVEVPGHGDISQRGTVLLAKGIQHPKMPTVFNWELIIHGRHPFFVTTAPRENLGGGAGERDCVPLVWPKENSQKIATETEESLTNEDFRKRAHAWLTRTK